MRPVPSPVSKINQGYSCIGGTKTSLKPGIKTQGRRKKSIQ
jgi:hypothetical protein